MHFLHQGLSRTGLLGDVPLKKGRLGSTVEKYINIVAEDGLIYNRKKG